MRVYISADIEGVAGVVAPAQGQAGHVEYEKARILMTEEVNAVVEGLVEAGATEILVNDSRANDKYSAISAASGSRFASRQAQADEHGLRFDG